MNTVIHFLKWAAPLAHAKALSENEVLERSYQKEYLEMLEHPQYLSEKRRSKSKLSVSENWKLKDLVALMNRRPVSVRPKVTSENHMS